MTTAKPQFRHFSKLAVGITVLIACALPASANPIVPGVEYSGTVSTSFWDGTQFHEGTDFIIGPSGSRGGSSLTSGLASYSSALGLSPMVTASSSANSSDFFHSGFGNVNFSLDYFFEVTGPTPVESVHVTASGISNGTAASAALAVRPVTVFEEPAILESPFRNWTMDTDFSVVVGTLYDVTLNVQTVTLSAGTGLIAASATVDPIFTIDPTLSDADQYQIFFSPGVGDDAASAVPEPSTCAMLLSGLAGLGLVRARVRRRNAKAPARR